MNRLLSQSEATSSTSHVTVDYAKRLAQACTDFASLPEDLCPASCPPSPTADMRIGQLTDSILEAVSIAGCDPTHPKWGHVSHLVQLGCTSRGYVGALPGVRVGDMRKANIRHVEWTLPETDEQWWEYERQWGHAFLRAPHTKGTTSKYWKHAPEEVEAQTGSRPIQKGGSKAELIREKITTWQATIVPEAADPSATSHTASECMSQAGDKGKGMEKLSEISKSQSSLGFSVVKRSGTANGKPEKAKHNSKRALLESGPSSPVDMRISSPPHEPIHDAIAPEPSMPSSSPDVLDPGIAEISEMSFLPPSFPAQLETSTPQQTEKAKTITTRQKPAPIPYREPPSSPLSSPPPTQHMIHAESIIPSSKPSILTTREATKRPRRSPSPPEDAMDISSHGISYLTPTRKKARKSQESSGAPPPPSTPPPVTSPAEDDSAVAPWPLVNVQRLGNAKGLPVPTTPERHPLPTLTELLASSRRSRPRPRPPSRKGKSVAGSPQANEKHRETDEQANVLPALSEDREPSPARTYFSSPASGSSGSSPGSIRYRPRSPISPLFTQNPTTFRPAFVSSQAFEQRGAGFLGVGSFGDAQGGQGLMRSSSGIFAMGYNSQFDVEGQVDRVSALLDQDVDYDGWLRDVPEIEEGESQSKLKLGY